MTDVTVPPPSPGKATATPVRGTLFGAIVGLWPSIWPHDRADLKRRVIWSMVLLVLAKLTTLTVPFTYKWAVDALSGEGTAPVAQSSWLFWVVASPIVMTLSYGLVRILMAILTQLRDGIFAKVS